MQQSAFDERLRQSACDHRGRRWLFVPYDQLSDRIGPLRHESPETLGIVLIESLWKARRRPVHKQKLALVLANMRHFALEQADRGIAVQYVRTRHPYSRELRAWAREHGPLRVMRPAEWELRQDLAPLLQEGLVEELPHDGWLTTTDQFRRGAGRPPWRMDAFYRLARRETGILMQDGKPEGGRFSFDGDNRRAWTGQPPAPQPPRFRPDAITREVVTLIDERFSDAPGSLDPTSLPATAEDARTLVTWFLEEGLDAFGPYEDAMSQRSSGLFHSRLAALLHLQRVAAAALVEAVAASRAPLQSREGFVRQVLGWREYMHHVHEATDGLRRVPPGRRVRLSASGAADPSHLQSHNDLPAAWWKGDSGLHCLDTVVQDVWREGYSHHITRLMILSNLATLLDVSPRQLTDWFWCAYVDAFDWVVETNVLGMGSFALGDLFTTKPYVSGTPYIQRMSDYCRSCRFDPRGDCPVSSLYWAFLARHRQKLGDLQRMRLPLRNLERRPVAQKTHDAEVFEIVSRQLRQGRTLTPDLFEAAE
jgi:deoxyribodipyrimidine photolyase-related protein